MHNLPSPFDFLFAKQNNRDDSVYSALAFARNYSPTIYNLFVVIGVNAINVKSCLVSASQMIFNRASHYMKTTLRWNFVFCAMHFLW